MYYYDFQVVLQEVPGEISLCFSICGCQLKCKGCHSSHLWKESNGKILLLNNYLEILNKYRNYATCVLFMGGEWHEDELIEMLRMARHKKFKTCLYTGEESISKNLMEQLSFLKTGKWNPDLGGLGSPKTNQKFIDVQLQKNLNYLFSKN